VLFRSNPSHTYTSFGTYTVKLTCSNNFGTDSLVKTGYITINAPSPPNATGTSICGSGVVTLNQSGIYGPNLYWYNSASGGTLLGTGPTFVTPFLTTSTTYYVQQNSQSLSQYVGKFDSSGTGHYSTQPPSDYLIFNCYYPVKLASVLVYSNSTGNRTIELRDSGGTLIQSVTINIPSGQIRVPLNFDVPVGNNLSLRLAVSSMANLRLNSGGNLYPYDLPGIISITGSSPTGGNNGYYFFFKWEIIVSSCVSPRTAVTAYIMTGFPWAGFTFTTYLKSIICTNTSINASNYLWDFGDGSTSNQINPAHYYSSYGSYIVSLNASNSCGGNITSHNVNFTTGINNIPIDDDFELFPNPNNGTFELNILSSDKTDLHVNIFNNEGKKVYYDMIYLGEKKTSKSYNLSKLEKGIYQFQLISKSKVVNKLLVIQ
jgi:PKD repeat protein